MSEHAQPDLGATVGSRGASAAREYSPSATPTLWVGWVWFAGAMMVMLGFFGAIYGLVAIFNDEYFVVGPENILVFDLTTWGWLHLIVGIVAVAAGIALFFGSTWARVVAVLLAMLNAVMHLLAMSAYPVWSLIMIALDIVIIWAVIVHGDELKTEEWD